MPRSHYLKAEGEICGEDQSMCLYPGALWLTPKQSPNCPKYGCAPLESFLSRCHRYSLVGLHMITLIHAH